MKWRINTSPWPAPSPDAPRVVLHATEVTLRWVWLATFAAREQQP
jgi:hypothetical protein